MGGCVASLKVEKTGDHRSGPPEMSFFLYCSCFCCRQCPFGKIVAVRVVSNLGTNHMGPARAGRVKEGLQDALGMSPGPESQEAQGCPCGDPVCDILLGERAAALLSAFVSVSP